MLILINYRQSKYFKQKGGDWLLNKNWSNLNHLQLGKLGEYFAKLEATSYGLEVYSIEIDDRGIDFIIKNQHTNFYEIQVKSVRLDKNQYVFIKKDKFNIYQNNLFLFLLLFKEGELPATYLIPASAWQTPNNLFKDREYENLKSTPEYGLNLSKKNCEILNNYLLRKMVRELF